MKTTRSAAAKLLLAATQMLVVATAPAQTTAPVTVPGFSFEDPVTGTYNGGLATGWGDSDRDSAGYQVAAGASLTGATGAQVGWANSGQSLWSAANLGTYVAGVTYVLTVDVASRGNFTSSGFTLELVLPDAATQVATTGTLDPLDDYAMHPYQLSYTVPAGSPFVGQGIRIKLTNIAGSNQTNFDNVRLDAIIPPAPLVTWMGNLNDTWDINSTANWTTDALPATYGEGNLVRFDDTATGTTTVNNTVPVAPGSITVSNVSKAYTLGGAAINCAGTLTKTGANTLTLTGASNFTFGISIGEGTVELGGAGQLGGGTYAGDILNNGTFLYNSSADQALAGIMSGTGALSKSGDGTLTLSTINTFTGGTTVNGGTLALGAGGQAGIIGNNLTINSGGTVSANQGWALGIGDGPDVPVTHITINGGTLSFVGSANNGGMAATTVSMTGGSISGADFDWYSNHSYATMPTLTTLASATTAEISSGMRLRLGGGQITFDVAAGSAPGGVDLLISGPILDSVYGDGGIIKTGAGKALLSGANTYVSATTINGGTLALTGSATMVSPTITVASGATLAVADDATVAASTTITLAEGGRLDTSGLTADFTLASGQSLSAGRSTGFAEDVAGNLVITEGALHIAGSGTNPGTLTQTGNLTLDGCAVKFDLNTTTTPGTGVNDLIAVDGDITLAATTHISVTKIGGVLDSGTYTLLSCSGTLSGDATYLALDNLPDIGRQTYALATTSNSIVLNVTGVPLNLVWTGADSLHPTFWDAATTANWSGEGDGKFADGDRVAFDETATSTTVDIQGFMAPESVTFNNGASKPYSIIGSGSIDGSTGITKNGDGVVTIASDNAYTGTTAINAGSLSVATLPNSNSTGPLGLGGQIVLGAAATTGTLQYTGDQTSTNRTITLAAGGGVVEVTTPATSLTWSGVISGAGGLTKSGDGTLALTNINTFSGGTTVNGGTLALGSGGDAGIIGNNLTINSGATVSANQNWALGIGDGPGIPVTHIAINGGTLSFVGSANGGGMVATTVSMTGGSISGADFDWYSNHQYATMPTLTTLASATTAEISSGMRLRLGGGQITFDVAAGSAPGGVDLLISGPILDSPWGDGGIIKTGAGKARLTGVNTYVSATTVNAGLLEVNGSLGASSAVTVAASATLAGTGSISGNVSVASGGFVAPGSAGIGTLSVGSAALTGTYQCQLDVASGDQVIVTGALTVNPGAAIVVSTLDTPTAASYIIATYGTLAGGAPTVTGIPSGYVLDVATAGQIKLVKSAGGFGDWADSWTGPALSDKTPGGDPDGDGISNVMEYVIGGDPRVASTSYLPGQAIVGTDLVLSYERSDASEADTTQTGQWSTNLTDWTDLAPLLVNENDADPDSMEIRIPQTNAVGGKLFGRLNVTKP